MAEVLNIEDKIKAVSDTTTETELSTLKTELSTNCLAPEKLTSLRAIIEAKKDITNETKVQLQALLSECQKPVETSEVLKTSSFEQVFSETRSEIFSKENIDILGKMIDKSFDNIKLDSIQHENIRLGIMDKLLKDPEIQKLFDMKIGVVDILNSVAKGQKTEILKVDEANSQMEVILRTIADRINVANQPLLKLMKDKGNTLPVTLLSNPEEIAKYNGGEVSNDIQAMSEINKKSYIENLKGNVHKIDKKIFPMEQIKEQGMNFLANAPSFLVDFFKWLLSFDFIAKFLGYNGTQEEREGQLDNELKQRRSLGILQEFGQVSDVREGKIENTKKSGKYSGDIKTLEGKDLSGISRKKLTPFFQFTKEEGVDIETKEFWMGVFNEGKIVGKNSKGEIEEYRLKKIINSKDLDKNYEGLYEKLNDLLDEKKKKDYKKQLKIGSDSLVTTQFTITNGTEKTSLTSTEQINKFPILGKLTPEQQSKIRMGYVSGEWAFKIPETTEASDKNPMIMEFATLNKLFKNEPLFQKSILEQSHKEKVSEISLKEILSYKDTAILAMNTEINPATVIVRANDTQKVTEKTALMKAFENADNIPFQFGNEWVKFENSKLTIGDKQFALELSNGGFVNPSVSSIELIGKDVKLRYFAGNVFVPRSKIIEGIPVLIGIGNGSSKEIFGDEGKLIITRVV